MNFNYSNKDTICAIASALLPAPIGIIRVSGSKILKLIPKLFKNFNTKNIIPRKIYHSKLYFKNNIIDDVVFVFYKKPNSYTGEDLLEIFPHGNPILLNHILNILLQLGCRIAYPGEFSYRALHNNKINLLQAEAINEIITANNLYSIQNVQKILTSNSLPVIQNLKNNFIDILSLLEVQIDFSDQDISVDYKQINKLKKNSIKIIDLLIDNAKKNISLKKGLNIIICGKPNVGKSSLLNFLLNQERALTSDIPGTTRDYIKETIYINNFPVNIIDTAGIRKSHSILEKKSIEKTIEMINSSDLIIFILDITNINENDFEIYNLIKNKNFILLINKIDLFDNNFKIDLSNIKNKFYFSTRFDFIDVSIKNKINLNNFYSSLSNYINKTISFYNSENAIYFFNERHLSILENLKNNLLEFLKEFNHLPLEILIANINFNFKFLNELFGEISNKDILTNIFSSFCIGK